LWNQQFGTDRTITNNKPDDIIRNKNGTCLLIDIAIPTDRNVIKKEAAILKYKDLLFEIQRIWKVRAQVIPIIIGATGMSPCHSKNIWPTSRAITTSGNFRKPPF
jgi:hypothetical protein